LFDAVLQFLNWLQQRRASAHRQAYRPVGLRAVQRSLLKVAQSSYSGDLRVDPDGRWNRMKEARRIPSRGRPDRAGAAITAAATAACAAGLVERELALQLLADRLQGVAGGIGHMVLLGGEAGIGKTSLLKALAASRGAAQLWWGACDALQTPQPLAPLHDIARAGEGGFHALLAADGDRAALFGAVLLELQRSERPVLFVVEDVHWADEATLDLLKFLGRRIDRAPCLLVASYRDDEVAVAHPLRRLMGELPGSVLTRMDVQRLSPAAVEVLARRALRSPTGIHAATQGNPFFVTELLQHGSGGVPRGVQDLVLARFARLDPKAQAIVQLASVVPAKIERWLVESLLGNDVAALEQCLDAGLLTASASTLGFRHELARNAVESSLSAPAAQALHARVLHALEQDGRTSAPLARLAHHAMRAGDAAAILRYAPDAGRQAQQRGAHREAAAHYRAAVEHAAALPDVSKAELLDQQSYECYLIEQITEAIAARESSLELWRKAGDGLKAGDALRWLSRLYWLGGQTTAAMECAIQAIAALESLPHGRELAMAYGNRAQLHMVIGEADTSLLWGNKALALASALDDRETEIHALGTIGTAKVDIEDFTGFMDLERSLSMALEAGFEEHVARAFSNLSYSAVCACDRDAAHDYIERGIAYCEERDLDSWARFMSAYRCQMWLARGDWDRAVELAIAFLRAEVVTSVNRIPALVILGRIRARRGDADAREPLDEARQLASSMDMFRKYGLIGAACAEEAWLRGDLHAVVAEARAVWDEDVSFAWVPGELAYWLQRADALDAMPKRCAEPYALQIAGHWREAADAWERHGCPYERARALTDGDVDAQIEALAVFEQLGARPDAERLRRQLQAAGVRGLRRGQRLSTQANAFQLTAREVEVLQLLCAGLKNAEIAGRLCRSVRTVDHHLAAVFAKLGVATRTEAVAAAMQAGMGTER
jgi:DNA-binding CsgD family transcriptional regulator/tetratricopeptide (TPR) repeat protein